MYFQDRKDAGLKLARALQQYAGEEPVIYALPRGGVVLGVEVSRQLKAALDLLIVRKIGHPFNPEYAVAAVGADGDIVKNTEEVAQIDPEWFKAETAKQRAEANRRRKLYLGGRKPVSASGKTCVIVDDGLATGLTMKVAIAELRHQKPKKIIVAVPVAPAETVEEIGRLADDIVALHVPAGFFWAI